MAQYEIWLRTHDTESQKILKYDMHEVWNIVQSHLQTLGLLLYTLIFISVEIIICPHSYRCEANMMAIHQCETQLFLCSIVRRLSHIVYVCWGQRKVKGIQLVSQICRQGPWVNEWLVTATSMQQQHHERIATKGFPKLSLVVKYEAVSGYLWHHTQGVCGRFESPLHRSNMGLLQSIQSRSRSRFLGSMVTHNQMSYRRLPQLIDWWVLSIGQSIANWHNVKVTDSSNFFFFFFFFVIACKSLYVPFWWLWFCSLKKESLDSGLLLNCCPGNIPKNFGLVFGSYLGKADIKWRKSVFFLKASGLNSFSPGGGGGHSHMLVDIKCLSIDPLFLRRPYTQWPPFFIQSTPNDPLFSTFVSNFT